MKPGLYPKIALGSIRKNGRLYIPFFATCILMVSVFYIMHFLAYSGITDKYVGSSTATDMLAMGTYVMAIFGTIFLFYTQSALIKGRKKEFGLYSVLGMNRRNLGRIILCESVITWFVAIAGGLITGIGLSKLAELGFAKMIQAPISYEFTIAPSSIAATIITYSIIFVLISLNALRQVKFTSTINLIHADKAGEKPPKANWFVGILGFVILLTGYFLALRIKQPLSALMVFFVAAILVIIGTYLVLIAGSVLLCKILQKNKNYYYKTNHFVSVSSMAYRMKRNGAALASICILLTMILVMISSTSSLYLNSEETLSNRCPNHMNSYAQKYGYDRNNRAVAEKMEKGIMSIVEDNGTKASDISSFENYFFTGYYQNGKLDLDVNPMENFTTVNYDNVVQVYFFDARDYNRLTGENVTLSKDDIITGTIGNVAIDDKLLVGEESFNVVDRFDYQNSKLNKTVMASAISTILIVVDDLDEVASRFESCKDISGEPMVAWCWNFRFDTDLDSKGQIELGKKLNSYIHGELDSMKYVCYCESHEGQRSDYVSTFGGFFFLGILLSIIFLVSCVLIIYYKQISEGFEDQARFDIMQKVGMTKENIKKSINSQMLTVFLIPIIGASIHLVVVLPIIHKLLMLFGYDNMPLLILSAGICALICAVFYSVIYKLTSNAYYKIVS